jgi:N-dimethylarginine dimethylaminohydrolase
MNFSPYGQKGKIELNKKFFDHLDVFVNSIPEKNILLVDPEYLSKNQKLLSIAKEIGFRLITIPKEEQYYYPANFLALGNGEVIVNSKAKQTIQLLKKNGVNVFATPKGISANLTMNGGVGCFVNVD